MLINSLPARPADTELEVAITVVRLIATAAVIGKLNTRIQKWNEKNAATEAKRRTETAGDDTGNENDERQGRSDRGHAEV